MINGESVLAVIPARGGSKRCPRKNILPFRGKPLIEWTCDVAKKSRYIDLCVFSTDDREIFELARSFFDGMFMRRPPQLADDMASNEDVLRYVSKLSTPAEWLVLLQPTSPLRTAADIDACIERATLGNACISYRSDGTKNGAVYVARASWLAKYDFSSVEHMRYVMPDERSLDIDYPEQFE